MRKLTPLFILLLGALLTGATFATADAIFTPDDRMLRGIYIFYSGGAVFGLLMFAPIAFAEKFRVRILVWLQRYWPRLQPRVSFLMTLALGYFFACARHKNFDIFSIIAVGLVFVGAMLGLVIGIASSDNGDVPGERKL